MKTLYTLLLCLISLSLFSIDYSSEGWKTYVSYSSTDAVEESSDLVYVLCKGALYTYGKEDNSIKLLNKGTGLSDSDIKFITYNNTTKSLLIVYDNSNIDILKGNEVRNIPYLNTTTSVTIKTVNHVDIYDQYAYLSTVFGIVVINMEKNEISATYNLSNSILSCAVFENYIYAATEKTDKYPTTLIKASMDDNLMDPESWKAFSLPGMAVTVNQVLPFNGKMMYAVNAAGVYYENDNKMTSMIYNPYVKEIRIQDNKFVCRSERQIFIFSSFTQYDQINNFSVSDINTYKDNIYWVAKGEEGLQAIKKGSDNTYSPINEPIIIDGPYTNSAYKMKFFNNKLFVIPGGRSIVNGSYFDYAGNIMILDNDKWSVLSASTVTETLDFTPKDYTSLVLKMNGTDEVLYASMGGEGIIEFTNDKPTKRYDHNNSTIENILQSSGYCRMDGLSFDKSGNLWMSNSEVSKGIKIMDKDGNWHGIASEALKGIHSIFDVFITSNNDKWVNVPRPATQKKVVVLADNSSLDEADSYSYELFTDTDGNEFAPSYFNCFAEDKKGYVWLGTNKGAVYFANPRLAASANNASLRCTRIKMEDDDGQLYYFLDNVMVSCIKVDAGNRKWIGTLGNGIYVLNNNNKEIVHQFSTENSPLPSDDIYDIEFNNATGEVFIGTDKGLLSYQGEATEGKDDYSEIKVFPNPVKPENDKVTISGLMDNSIVKITDLNGNLLYQTTSMGGQITWNCRNKSGNRVVTGVYLVLAASENSSESVIAKVAIIK